MTATRIERRVEQACVFDGLQLCKLSKPARELVLKLIKRKLANERRQVRRIVEKERKRLYMIYSLPGGTSYYRGVQACLDILSALSRKERR
jgi:hypothetical protein